MIIQASSAIVDGALLGNTWIESSDGVITSVNPGIHSNPDTTTNGVLIPGFVDIHCHGGGGHYFSAISPDSITAAINAHKKTGTTSLVASLVSESIEDLKAQIQRLIPFYNRGEIVGIHLEGPYLSHARCGAHEPSLLIDPTVEQLKELVVIGQGSIKMVTIAPELQGYTVIVDKSTVPVGTADQVARIIREVNPEAQFDVASNPESVPKNTHNDPSADDVTSCVTALLSR